MFFQTRNSHTGSLFKLPKIQKSFDKTALGNCVFVSKSLKVLLLSIFSNWFKLSLETQFQILDFLKYPHTVLKPIVDIQCL